MLIKRGKIMDKIAICEVYYLLESDWNQGGILQERPSNARRNMSTGYQLSRMNFKPSPLLAWDSLDQDQRELYVSLCETWGLGPVCVDCGQAIIKPKDSFSTGYGVQNGFKVCFACCGKQDSVWMQDHDKITLYLTMYDKPSLILPGQIYKAAKITNWPGTLEFKTNYVKQGLHNFAGVRYDVWFKDEHGNRWWGVQYGDNTQLLHCKKLKTQ
jgi:hypothetical protein